MTDEDDKAQALWDEYMETVRADLYARIFALLSDTPKIKNNEEGRAVIRDACLAALRDHHLEDMSSFVGISTPEELAQGIVTVAPTPAAPIAVAFHGFPASVPGVCDRWDPCGKADCTKCFPGKVLRPDQRGSKKPGGGGSKGSRAERGYRVLSYDAHLSAATGERPGDCYSTPDVAQKKARDRARAEGRHVLILRDGERYQLYRADGEVLQWSHASGGWSRDL